MVCFDSISFSILCTFFFRRTVVVATCHHCFESIDSSRYWRLVSAAAVAGDLIAAVVCRANAGGGIGSSSGGGTVNCSTSGDRQLPSKRVPGGGGRQASGCGSLDAACGRPDCAAAAAGVHVAAGFRNCANISANRESCSMMQLEGEVVMLGGATTGGGWEVET